jgi:hypothetical protein
VFNKILNDSNNDVSNKYLAKTQSFVIFLSHDFDYESKIANKKIQEWFTYFFFQISNRSINQFQFKLAHFAL